MKNKYITEIAMSKIVKFLGGIKRIYATNVKKIKKFIEAIIWMSRTGAQWRELPERYGRWNSVFCRFNEWSKKNIWQQLHEYCIQDPDLEYVMIDATIIRANACAAGYKKGQQKQEGLGRSVGGFSSKIHAKVDALGNPLQFIITAGQVNDVTEAKALLEDLNGSHTLADKAYDSDNVREIITAKDGVPVIPPKSNRKVLIEYDKELYEERHLIECFFSKIKYFRRIFSRFDKSKRNFFSFLSLVGALIWLR
jgi:transposase